MRPVPRHWQLQIAPGDRSPVPHLQVSHTDPGEDPSTRDGKRQRDAHEGEDRPANPYPVGRSGPFEGRNDHRVGDPTKNLADRDSQGTEGGRGTDRPHVGEPLVPETTAEQHHRSTGAGAVKGVRSHKEKGLSLPGTGWQLGWLSTPQLAADFQAISSHGGLDLTDCQVAEVEDACSKHGIGAGPGRGHEVFRRARPPARD